LRIVETVHAPHLVLTPHEHEDPCIVAAIEGWWEERVESRAFTCGPGSFLSKPAGARHGNAYGTEITRAVIVQLTVTRAATWEPSRNVFSDCVYFQSPRTATRLVNFLTHPDDWSAFQLEEEISGIFSLLSGGVRRRRKKFYLRSLERVRDELVDDPISPRCLAELAATCDLSPSAFTHAFRDEFGCPPSMLIRRRRVELAASILRRSARPLSNVALTSGFADQAHMTREFRRIVGTTPGAFRRLAAS